MRQLFRRLRACEAGAGLVEYALVLAVVALGLVGALRLFRNAVGGLTNRTAVGVSTAGGSYGAGGAVGWAPGGPTAHSPATADPDSASAQPESSSASGGATTALGSAIP